MGLFGKSKRELLEWQNIIAPNTPKLMWNEAQLRIFTERSVTESLKTIQESMNLCNTTKRPAVFFKRYDIILYQMDVLARLEKFVRFDGDQPGEKLIELKNCKYSEIDKMIDRSWKDTLEKINTLKTKKAKINKVISFRAELDGYSEFMNNKNIDKYEKICNDFLEEYANSSKTE